MILMKLFVRSRATVKANYFSAKRTETMDKLDNHSIEIPRPKGHCDTIKTHAYVVYTSNFRRVVLNAIQS